LFQCSSFFRVASDAVELNIVVTEGRGFATPLQM